MGRKKQDRQTLRQVSEHLFYEHWMLQSLALKIHAGEIRNRVVQNALLESFVLHTRVLIEFLYAETAWHDTVLAIDFFAQPDDWFALRLPISTTLKSAKARVGKDAAHLTYTRLETTQQTRRWPIREIAKDIQVVMKVFEDNAPPASLSWHWHGGFEDDDED